MRIKVIILIITTEDFLCLECAYWLRLTLRFILKLKFRYRFKFRLKLKFRLMFRFNINLNLGSVVQRPDSDIHWIAIFSTFIELAVDGYNLRLRFHLVFIN